MRKLILSSFILLAITLGKLSAQTFTIARVSTDESTSPLLAGSSNRVLLGFSVTRSGANTASNFNALQFTTSTDPNSVFSSVQLFVNTAATGFGSATVVGAATATLNATDITFANTTYHAFAAGAGSTDVPIFFYIVATVKPGTATTTAGAPKIQLSFDQTKVGFSALTPTAFSITGTDYNFQRLETTIDQTGVSGIAASPLTGGTNDRPIFGFRAASNGTQSLSSIKIAMADPASVLSGFRVIASASGTFPGVTGNIYTGTYNGGTNTIDFDLSGGTGPEAITIVPKFFFVVADVNASVTGATPALTPSLTTAGITVTQSLNSFTTITGAAYSFTGLTATLAPLASVSPSPLTAGTIGLTTQNGIFGFSLSSNGSQTATLIKVAFDNNPVGKFTGYQLISSTDNSFLTTGDNASVPLTSSNITGAGPYFVNLVPTTAIDISGSKNLFLVVTVNGNANSNPGSSQATGTITPSLSTVDITLSPVNITANSFSGSAYSFIPSASSTIEANAGTSSNIDFSVYSVRTASSALVWGASPNSSRLGTFDIKDGGGAADADGQPTIITSITIDIDNPQDLQTVAIFDGNAMGSTKVGEQTVGGGTVVFGGLTLTAAEGATTSFTIRTTFKSTVGDNNTHEVQISSVVVSPSGSSLSGSGLSTALSGASSNNIIVDATELTYNTFPTTTTPATPFTVVFSATDANGNVDEDFSEQAEITESGPGPGNISNGGLKSPVLGVYTFSTLSINLAGDYDLQANDAGGGVNLSSVTQTIDIASLGVIITDGVGPSTPPPALTLCVGGTFQNLGNIKITESDPSDFGTGTNVSFSLVLPTGYVFDPSILSAPSTTGAEISGVSGLSYSAGNTIVRFTYSVSGTSVTNSIMITGLKVKYTLLSAPSDTEILRIGGTASQAGNSETDGAVHGTLTVNDPTMALYPTFGFISDEVPGEPTIDDDNRRFSATTNTVLLKPKPGIPTAGGVFSGNGVSLSATYGGYIFSPKAVGSGSNYPITYSVPDPNAPNCTLFATEIYEVFATAITNLDASYCSNSVPSTGLTVSQVAINNAMSWTGEPANSWNLFQFVYYKIGTGYVPLPADINGDFDTFDPLHLDYQASILTYGGVYIYYQVRHDNFSVVGDPYYNTTYYGQYQFVPVYSAPAVSLFIDNASSNDFCENNSTLYELVGSPAPNSALTDNFSFSQGVTHPSGNNWRFQPSAVSAASHSTPFGITYTFKDPLTGCSNTSSPLMVTVYPQPGLVDGTTIERYDNNAVRTPAGTPVTDAACQFGGFQYLVIGNGVTAADNRFNWYSDASLNEIMYQQNWYFYPYTVNTSTVGSTSFYVTQTINGCESQGLEIEAVVDLAPSVEAGDNLLICSTNDVLLSDLSPAVSGSATGTGSMWKAARNNWGTVAQILADPADGEFLNGSDVAIVGNAIFNTSKKYSPGVMDIKAGFVYLYLLSEDPAGECGQIFDFVIINISQSPTAIAGTIPGLDNFIYCANDNIVIKGAVNGATTATTLTWSVLPAGGTIESPTAAESRYTPTVNQLNFGGTLTFTLTTNDPDGVGGPCIASTDNMSVKINPRATINAGTDFAECSDKVITLNGSKPASSVATTYQWTGGTGTFVDDDALVTVYNYAPAEIGTHVILSLTSNDPDGAEPCKAETALVDVEILADPAAPTITPTNIQYYCVIPGVDGATTPLSANGVGLRWYNNPALSGSPSADPFATPITTKRDTVAVFYVTQTVRGCESAYASNTIVVNPAPDPSFTVSKFCLGDISEFTNSSTVTYNPSTGRSGQVVNWSWDFGNGFGFTQPATALGDDPAPLQNGLTGGTFKNPTHRYGLAQNYNPILKVTTSDGCSNSKSALNLFGSTLKIGPVPVADFDVRKLCEEDNTTFVSDAGPANTETLSWNWDFTDPDTGSANVSAIGNPFHKFSSYGAYDVSLTITTQSPQNCTNTVNKTVPILPYIKLGSYLEDFEDVLSDGTPRIDLHGWVNGSVVSNAKHSGLNSWQLTTPDYTTINSSANDKGEKVWITHVDSLDTYFDAERSILLGPCVDVSKIARPVMTFDYWNNTDAGNDGVFLEVAEPDPTTGALNWIRFGALNNGVEWYNRGLITGLTQVGNIGQVLAQIGWSGNTLDVGETNGWTNAKYSLDLFKTSTKLQIRFVFGSNSENPDITDNPLDGFALDNFKLSSRNRIMLIENFTNSLETTNNNKFEDYKDDLINTEVVKIQYHTGLGGTDEINLQNPNDPNARAAFYGLTNTNQAIPRVYLDGTSDGNLITATWADDHFSRRSLVDAPFKLEVTTVPSTNAGSLVTAVNFIPFDSIGDDVDRVLYVAVVEKSVGSDEYVVRKLLPSAAGEMLSYPIATYNPEFTWAVDNGEVELANLALVAFVQERKSGKDGVKQVVQSAVDWDPTNLPTLVTGIDPEWYGQLHIYPNPADGLLNIKLPSPVQELIRTRMIDSFGRDVKENIMKRGETETTFATRDLAGGMYILQLETTKGVIRKKIMVVHQ